MVDIDSDGDSDIIGSSVSMGELSLWLVETTNSSSIPKETPGWTAIIFLVSSVMITLVKKRQYKNRQK